VAAPALPIAQAIGRLGNWFNQELYGRPTDLPWALEIGPDNRPIELLDQPTFHPTFLYEGLWNLALAGLIIVGSNRIVLRPSRWFAVYVIGYGVGRLWVESLRIDAATELAGLRVNTWMSLVIIALGLLWLFWRGSPVDAEATERHRWRTGRDRGGGSAGGGRGPGRSRVPGGPDRVGLSRPDLDGPVAERSVGEHDAAQVDRRVEPQVRARAAEVPERRRGAPASHPVRVLVSPQLRAQTPVAGVPATPAGEHATQTGEGTRPRRHRRARIHELRGAEFREQCQQVVDARVQVGGRGAPQLRVDHPERCEHTLGQVGAERQARPLLDV
jgi:hypothetical protein